MPVERRHPRVLLLTLGVGLAGCAGASRAPDPDAAGAALYAGAGCGLCHGLQGRGDGPLAAAGRVQPVDLANAAAYRYGRAPDAVAAVIASGRSSERGVMPPHGHLTEREQHALAAYVLQLSQHAPGAPGTQEKR